MLSVIKIMSLNAVSVKFSKPKFFYWENCCLLLFFLKDSDTLSMNIYALSLLFLIESLSLIHGGHHTEHWYCQTGQDKGLLNDLQVRMGLQYFSPSLLYGQVFSKCSVGAIKCVRMFGLSIVYQMNNCVDRIQGICVKVAAKVNMKIPIDPRIWSFLCF